MVSTTKRCSGLVSGKAAQRASLRRSSSGLNRDVASQESKKITGSTSNTSSSRDMRGLIRNVRATEGGKAVDGWGLLLTVHLLSLLVYNGA